MEARTLSFPKQCWSFKIQRKAYFLFFSSQRLAKGEVMLANDSIKSIFSFSAVCYTGAEDQAQRRYWALKNEFL